MHCIVGILDRLREYRNEGGCYCLGIIDYSLLAFKNIEMIVFYIVRILTEAEGSIKHT